MAGISQILSIAKEALMAHQLSLQTASHNVSNVDTPGYTRQTLKLTSVQGAPIAVGTIGGGVEATRVIRNYDQLITQRITSQESTIGYLDAQQQSFRVVEAVFNEAQGIGLNALFSQFWNSWQDLAGNPDLLAARQAVVQSGEALIGHIRYMDSELNRIEGDLGMTLQNSITEVNRLSRELAQLNVEITVAESSASSANDLRDQRDDVLRNLAQYMNVTYYENKSGSYTVLLSDGHALVDAAQNWDLEWAGDSLYLLNLKANGTISRQELPESADLGGKIGGWMNVFNELQDNDPDSYQGQLDALANALIKVVNQQHSEGVGLVPMSGTVTGTESVPNTALLTTTVQQSTALSTITDGTIKINGHSIGTIEGGIVTNGLAMAKAYNAATAINDAEAGVVARLTTLTAGSAATGLAAGESVSFTVNGLQVSYTAAGAETAAQTAANVVTAINAAITAYNNASTTPIPMRITAEIGNGSNGGASNSIILKNTLDGDSTAITLGGIDTTADAKLGLTNGSFSADATHNTGKLSIFSRQAFTVSTGNTDETLNQLGMGGGLHSADAPGDGLFSFSSENNAVSTGLMGLSYANELATDGGSLDIWLYNADGSPAISQPVSVNLTGAYTLQDVARAINISITNTTGDPSLWVQASVVQGKLSFSSDGYHKYAFANDTANILQVSGINTFFSGTDAGSIAINSAVAKNLDLLASGSVNANGEIFRGDNTNALKIADLQYSQIGFSGGANETLDDFYNSLVSAIGNSSRSTNRSLEFNTTLQSQLQELRDSVSGVSLDEEMANLIKFQHAYAAAAKLITMSDEMLLSLLDAI